MRDTAAHDRTAGRDDAQHNERVSQYREQWQYEDNKLQIIPIALVAGGGFTCLFLLPVGIAMIALGVLLMLGGEKANDTAAQAAVDAYEGKITEDERKQQVKGAGIGYGVLFLVGMGLFLLLMFGGALGAV